MGATVGQLHYNHQLLKSNNLLNMKYHVEQLLKTAIQTLQTQGQLPNDLIPHIQVEHTRDKQHGDFASSVALGLAKACQRKPRELAEQILAAIPTSNYVQKVEIAGPGFINFFLTSDAWQAIVKDIFQAGDQFGRSQRGAGQRIHLEFVSSNPTGPLHVGHGRGAAYGAAVADVLEAAGFDVHREYYVNDGGRQMDILATSVWLRYLALCGEEFVFPSNAYKGEYVIEIAQQIKTQCAEKLCRPISDVFADVPPDEPLGGDKEKHIDALISNAKKLLGAADYRMVFDLALTTILDDIREDLAGFGVNFQEWFSERSLVESGAVDRAIAKLKANDYLYEQDGALWFRSTHFGDDKDRVVLRENGQPTYFAADVAYRLHNLERGYTQLVNVLGSDHHGYVARVRAAIEAFGYQPAPLKVLMVQFAVLYRGEERVQMSTRGGEFVTLRELREEVGNDAARFFYVMRKSEQHMDFDLELAKSQSNDNPVFYVQYAHARVCSVLRQLAERKLSFDQNVGLAELARLKESHEIELLVALARYVETVELAAVQYEPHLIANYLRDLAQAFHAYYNAHPFLVEDTALRNARLALVIATRQVLSNGLKLLGVSAPEVM